MVETAKTMKAGDHGVLGCENLLRQHDGSVRYFSVRECARLQTFPDDWVLEGSWTESMRQLGNAVPVQMAETVASELFRAVARNHDAVVVNRNPTTDRHAIKPAELTSARF